MNIPETLQNRLAAGKVIPFVGAGVSMAVKGKETGEPIFPSWWKLLDKAADRLDAEGKIAYVSIVRGMLELNNFLGAACHARDGLGATWFEFIKQEIDHSYDQIEPESLELARVVWELGSRLIITVNYDKVLSWACPQQFDCRALAINAPAEQVDLLRSGVTRPTVWHLHGHIDNAAELILTPDGYKRLYGTDDVEISYKAALHTLRSLLASHTLLFIGFSLDDSHLGLQLRGIHEIFEGAAGPHYVLIREADQERAKSLKTSLNLPVEIITFADFGEPLIQVLREVAAAAKSTPPSAEPEPKGSTASSNYNPRNRVFFVPFRRKGDQVIGREAALQAVRSQLTQGHRTAIGQTAAFRGLGGLGKTQLAVEYAYTYQAEYPNGVIWLNADQDIDAQLIELSDKARWIASESEHKYKLDIARNRLRTYSDCLIIFDNLEALEDIEDYLPVPEAEPHILVTSRLDHPYFVPVPIDPLDEALSLELLFQEAGQEPTDEAEYEAAREVAIDLGGLPLALEMAGAYLRHRPVSWHQYRELLQQNLRAALPDRFLEASFTKHETDLYATLKVSDEVFAEEPVLRDILDLLTWSGPALMGSSLMSTLLNSDRSADFVTALNLGVALHLIQKTPGVERYAIHRLVREVRRAEMSLEEYQDGAQNIYKRIGDWFEERRQDFTNLVEFESEIDHLQEWQKHAAQFAPGHSSRLTWLQAYPPHYRGRYQESKHWLQVALRLFESAELKGQELQAHLQNDLGFAYDSLGDSGQALQYFQQALEINQEVLGEKHPDTARSLNNIGSAYNSLGDSGQALQYFQQALEINQEVLGEKHPDTATSLNNIGFAYDSLGDSGQALQYFQQALEINQEVLGEKHPDTARSLSNIGSAYNSLGDSGQALQYYQQALEIRLEVLGEKHPDTATSLNNIGTAYYSLGDSGQALQYYQQALELYQEVLGEKHPDTANSAYNMASLLTKAGQRWQAYQVLLPFWRLLPDEHPRLESFRRLLRRLLSKPLRPGFRQLSMQQLEQQRKQNTKK